MNIAIDKAAAAVAKIAAKDTSRPVLAGVSIKNGEARAADGFMLLVCPLPKENESQATVLLDAKELAAALKSLKPGSLASIAPNGTHATVTPMNPFGHPAAQFPVTQIDGTFPDANQIFTNLTKDDVQASVTLDARMLITFCEAFIVAHGGKGNAVPLAFHLRGADKPVTVASKVDNDRVMEGVIMPMVIKYDAHGNPAVPAQTRAERTP